LDATSADENNLFVCERPNYSELRQLFQALFIHGSFIYDSKYDWVTPDTLKLAMPAVPKAPHPVRHTSENAPEGRTQDGEPEANQ
jgi:hypothetical protein